VSAIAHLRRGAAGAAALWLAAAAPAGAGCSLALALALDVSSSVDAAEYRLQAEGVADALLEAEVQAAILAPGGEIHVAVFEWSGRRQHRLVADWTALTSPRAIADLAARVRGATRSASDFPTALGHAMGYAARLMARAPVCDRRVVDVSSDGKNNDGYAPRQAYRNFDMSDVGVNALVVGGVARPDLVDYFHAEVTRGPLAFVEIAQDYRDYARAMSRKLLREIRPPLAVGAMR
jgi:hypothetical protein